MIGFFYYAISAEWYFQSVVPWIWDFTWSDRDGIRGNPTSPLLSGLWCLIAIVVWVLLPWAGLYTKEFFEEASSEDSSTDADSPTLEGDPTEGEARLKSYLCATVVVFGGAAGVSLGLLLRFWAS
jgi:hypothetical protein